MEANKLNETFVPKELLKKSTLRKSQALIGTRTGDFDATTGNAFIRFEPVEVKFNGYQLNKPQTVAVKILNLAPIPQRVHILPPTQPNFSIKTNKKGSIAAGMAETVQITFSSDVHKYQYDVVKVNTQTGNFVIPIYAYPSIPKLKQIFPKIIDFGSVTLNNSESNLYPINNPVPLDFPFEFEYLQQSPGFIITPLNGIIPANESQNIEITFVPSEKKTYVAEAILRIKQFDFDPIKIKLMGTGKDKKGLSTTKRVKSSRLNPLKASQSNIVVDEQKVQLPNVMDPQMSQTLQSQKKSFIRSRTSYPKLLKKNVGGFTQSIAQNNEKSLLDIKKQGQKEYLTRYSRIQQLDKQKQVKFCQFLGDKAMTEEELQFDINVLEQTRKTKLNNLEEVCRTRYQNQLNNEGTVELKTFVPREVSWDMNKNDNLKLRKNKLQMFMNAGSKVIEKYRLEKRLSKIKEFLSDCQTREDVAKKVSEDYAKSLDVGKSGSAKVSMKLSFSDFSLQPTSFPLQFKDQGNSIKKLFQTQGKASFDDDYPLDQIKQHETQTMNYLPFNFPSDFVHPRRDIPTTRSSAEQQYPLKTASLPHYKPLQTSSVYNFPLNVPTHQFIYNDLSVARFKQCETIDEKSPDYLLTSQKQSLEDQFEGWSKGQMDVLKTKFLRNNGCQFSTYQTYTNNSIMDIGFLKDITTRLPKQIGNNNITHDDQIEQGDSDEECLGEIKVLSGEELRNQFQQKNQKAKERRGNPQQIQSFEKQLQKSCETNLHSLKMDYVSDPIRKMKEWNKWTEDRDNQLLI